MIDKLINLIRQNANDGIINNNAIPNEKNEQAVETAGSSIMATLQNALSGGRIKDVLGFFKSGNPQSETIVQEATANYANELQSNVGISETAAAAAASQVVPQAMQQLAQKTVDPSDNSFNIQDIFNNLSGGKTGGMDLQGMLNKFGGGKLDKDGDGDVDLADLKSMFSGNGGMMDKVKGLFS
ncbi:MAG: hypothetical protein V4717_09920 [Bacteroidota bacterium]